MKILAIDSSGLVASVAVVTEEALLAEYTIHHKKTHSQTLLPMLEEVKKMIELDLSDVDAIAVASGPGSFTGLRIGSATAKGLGLALNKPLISVSTLEGLAYHFVGSKDVICPLMDARRNQVYTGIYQFEGNRIKCIESPCAVDIAQIIEKINELGKEAIFLGDGIPVFKETLEKLVKVPCQIAPPNRCRQSAANIGVLALTYYQEGKLESAASHKPEYLRLSQAERERMEANHEHQ